VEKVLPAMVTKIYGHSCFAKLATDLWMFRGSMHMFALVINYFFDVWEHVHTTAGLFEVNEIIGSCMA
jgi:hypothetical protein